MILHNDHHDVEYRLVYIFNFNAKLRHRVAVLRLFH
jgi:hypothetical protein